MFKKYSDLTDLEKDKIVFTILPKLLLVLYISGLLISVIIFGPKVAAIFIISTILLAFLVVIFVFLYSEIITPLIEIFKK